MTDSRRCSMCDVVMESDDYRAHVSMCVSDSRTTLKWLSARHGETRERKPIDPRVVDMLRIVAIVTCVFLAGTAIVMLIGYSMVETWWLSE